MIKRLLSVLLLMAANLNAEPAFAQAPPDVVLKGVLTRADHETYREIPFEVPDGTRSITVDFDYEGREERTTVDLGLRGPDGFRGWSGGNKKRFLVSENDATPSYVPGPITPGRWHLILGIPNIRTGVRAAFTAKISFNEPASSSFASAALPDQGRWYRGDLHAHTAHSDGSCENTAGNRVPCPLAFSVAAAADRGLDFLAITEHNTVSHHAPMRELQAFYPNLLLIPGRELTTFQGHANLFGSTANIDFQLGSERAPNFASILDQVEDAGAILSVNHPSSPSGELCMGCGWTVPDTGWSRISAIEVINGGSVRAAGGQVETPLLGVPFWHELLNKGYRITAVGGSDNHDALMPAGQPQAIGSPSTWVHASELSQNGILEGIRAGRVFIDVTGQGHAKLEFQASTGDSSAMMGGILAAPAGVEVQFVVQTTGIRGMVEIIGSEGLRPIISDRSVEEEGSRIEFRVLSSGTPAWIRIDVRDERGNLLLIGNPIYLNR